MSVSSFGSVLGVEWMIARVAWRGEGEVYRQVDTVDKTAVQRNIRASDIPRLAWWNGLTSGVRIKIGMRTGGESDGERCVREDAGGRAQDVEATQVRLTGLQTYHDPANYSGYFHQTCLSIHAEF